MRRLVHLVLAVTLCLTVPVAYSAEKGKGGEKPKGGEPNKGGEKSKSENKGGSKPPGGAWSDGKSNPTKEGHNAGNEAHHEGAEGKNHPASGGKEGAAAGAAAANKNKPGASGGEGAAAGAAAANRNKPGASGAEGAAAGAAAANRNKPGASGAEGAAAGAAAANRNKPAASGAQGAAVGAAAANRNQPYASGAAGAAAGYAAVRNSFDHPSVYNADWYAAHSGAWAAPNLASGSVWTANTIGSVANHCGYDNNTAVSYGYGDNVAYQGGDVVVDGQNVGSAEDFSQQAADLAQIGHDATTSDSESWLPLGVFALVRNADQHAQITVQLAINPQGILRGNYTDLVSDHTQVVQGSVDNVTQRAAWTMGENKNVFMEAGLKNLTDGEAPALMHKYSKTEKWLLIRLPEPEATGDAVSDVSLDR